MRPLENTRAYLKSSFSTGDPFLSACNNAAKGKGHSRYYVVSLINLHQTRPLDYEIRFATYRHVTKKKGKDKKTKGREA